MRQSPEIAFGGPALPVVDVLEWRVLLDLGRVGQKAHLTRTPHVLRGRHVITFA